MKIGHNSFGYPLIANGTLHNGKRYLAINECGQRFSALWIFGRELVLAFNVFGFVGTVHWHVDWGLKPEIKRFDSLSNMGLENG